MSGIVSLIVVLAVSAGGATSQPGSSCSAPEDSAIDARTGLPEWAARGGFTLAEKSRVSDPIPCPVPGCYPPTLCVDEPPKPGCVVNGSTCSSVDTGEHSCSIGSGGVFLCSPGKTIHYDQCQCRNNCVVHPGNCSGQSGIANVRCE